MEAIVVDGVSKSFRISTEPANSLKERLVRLRPRRTTRSSRRSTASTSRSSRARRVGILGHNGSGKSTLLKCIAGILTPTTGEVRVRGRLASLLELGAGFHPDLTGRENVYINAAFYGMGRKEIDRVFDDIVEFAELAQFIDEPVKHYSSGMYVRLGFAVAVNLDPDVLLVDEVLAVGDEAFQVKCLSRIKQFQAEGRTIVFVTHAAETVRQICDRAIVLDHGRLVLDGEPGKAIRVFREHLHGQLDVQGRAGAGRRRRARSAPCGCTTATRRPAVTCCPGESLTVEVDLRAERPGPRAGARHRDRRPQRAGDLPRRHRRLGPAVVPAGRRPHRAHRHPRHLAARRRVPDLAEAVRPGVGRGHRLARGGGVVRGRRRRPCRRHRRLRRHASSSECRSEPAGSGRLKRQTRATAPPGRHRRGRNGCPLRPGATPPGAGRSWGCRTGRGAARRASAAYSRSISCWAASGRRVWDSKWYSVACAVQIDPPARSAAPAGSSRGR